MKWIIGILIALGTSGLLALGGAGETECKYTSLNTLSKQQTCIDTTIEDEFKALKIKNNLVGEYQFTGEAPHIDGNNEAK